MGEPLLVEIARLSFEVRKLQKTYFVSRDAEVLRKAKAAEATLDRLLAGWLGGQGKLPEADA